MSFIDKLSESITSGTEKVAKKAKEVSDVASLTAGMEKEKVSIEKLYRDIGKKMYEEHKDVLTSALPEETAMVDGCYERIDVAAASIKEAKGIRTCPSCGKEIVRESAFCYVCGAKL